MSNVMKLCFVLFFASVQQPNQILYTERNTCLTLNHLLITYELLFSMNYVFLILHFTAMVLVAFDFILDPRTSWACSICRCPHQLKVSTLPSKFKSCACVCSVVLGIFTAGSTVPLTLPVSISNICSCIMHQAPKVQVYLLRSSLNFPPGPTSCTALLSWPWIIPCHRIHKN